MANWKLHKYYRGMVLDMIRDRLNYLEACPFLLTKTQTHNLIKSLTKAKSTALMDNKQFLEYLEEVWCIGAHLGIYIPEPNETPMKLIERMVEMMEDSIIPMQHIITSPISIEMRNKTVFYVSSIQISMTHNQFGDEHFNITMMGTENALVTTRPGYKGTFATEIIDDLQNFIKYHVDSLSKDKANKIKQKIQSLEKELEECN